MTVLDAPLAHPTAYGEARLLAGVAHGRPVDLARHRAVHGELRVHDQDALAALTERVRLLGRGGAAFPVAVKLRAMPTGRKSHVMVNGSESEPASQKDRTLLRLVPHLVLDGALVVAAALRTTQVTVVVHDQAAAAAVRAAARQRRDASRVRVVVTEGGFVSGEVRAAMRAVDGRPPVPPGRRVLPHEHGLGGAPTFASNVETFAQLALVASLGADRFAEVGSPEEPGTMLLTLVGDVPHPGVVEVPSGLSLSALLPGQETDPRPVLVGGYHGSWVRDVGGLVLTRPALRAAGAPLNAGVIARLSRDTCPLAEVAAVGSWLAAQSAGQCGPCFFGLPAVAHDLGALLRGLDARADLARRVGQLPGRGACAHPDGAAMFVRTALAALADEVEVHRGHGGCGRPWLRELPTGAPVAERNAR
jgi:NADH:ubiquinone oxidoreductase subunit F (NADH-binding)